MIAAGTAWIGQCIGGMASPASADVDKWEVGRDDVTGVVPVPHLDGDKNVVHLAGGVLHGQDPSSARPINAQRSRPRIRCLPRPTGAARFTLEQTLLDGNWSS